MADQNAIGLFHDIAYYLAANRPLTFDPGSNARSLLRLLFCRFQTQDTLLTTDQVPDRFAAVKTAYPTAFAP